MARHQGTVIAPSSDVVCELRDAAIPGPAIAVRERLREVEIESNGAVPTITVEDKAPLPRIRIGANVRFEFEERPHMGIG